MFCPSCGANNPDGVAFCGSCGKPMPMPEVPRKDTSASYCPRCGAKLDAGAIFCGECGQRLGNNGEPSPIPSRSPVLSSQSIHKVQFNKKLVLLVVAAVIVIIAICAVGNFAGAGDGGRGTANEMAQTLNDPLNKVFSSGADEDSIRELAEAYIDGFPPEVINAELQKSNMTKEDAIDMAEDAFRYGMGSVSSVADYLDKMDVNATIKLGDQLDSDDVDSINDKISEYGIDDQVTVGYKLGADVTVTALDDLPALKKGETKSSDVTNLGIYTIKIGNRWYLWMPQFDW